MTTLGRISRGITLILTWFVKLVGLLGAGDQLLLHADHPSSVALAVAGCMVAGGEATERIVIAFIDRMMGQHGPGGPDSREDSRAGPHRPGP